MQKFPKFEEKIDRFVKSLFKTYKARKITDRKVIHDAVHGSNIFYEHEVAIIDTPLIQRLRRIHQTGLVFLTYPASVHKRFDHTLGVATLVNQYVDALNANLRVGQENLIIKKDPYGGDFANLRTAALLHDCGHAFFSHTSEEIYGKHKVIKQLKKEQKFKGRRPHEILSYYIVKSQSFKDWFRENMHGVQVDLDIVADMIIGHHENPDKFYLAQIINGPFDADKLDYIKRDSFFSGLKLTVDTERLFNTLTIKKKDGKNRIVLKSYIPTEQLVFSKRTLFSTVYHHQKVRACDSMVNSIIEYINNYKNHRLGNITIEDPIDYLYFDDYEIIASLTREDDVFIKRIISNILKRILYMRAFSICRSTVKDWETTVPTYMLDIIDDDDYRNELRKNIWEIIPPKVKNKYSLLEPHIQISFPKFPPTTEDETLNSYVIDQAGDNLIELNRFGSAQEWLNGYMNHKYKGFIFCPPEIEVREEVYKAAKEVFKSEKNIEVIDECCKRDVHLF